MINKPKGDKSVEPEFGSHNNEHKQMDYETFKIRLEGFNITMNLNIPGNLGFLERTEF